MPISGSAIERSLIVKLLIKTSKVMANSGCEMLKLDIACWCRRRQSGQLCDAQFNGYPAIPLFRVAPGGSHMLMNNTETTCSFCAMLVLPHTWHKSFC